MPIKKLGAAAEMNKFSRRGKSPKDPFKAPSRNHDSSKQASFQIIRLPWTSRRQLFGTPKQDGWPSAKVQRRNSFFSSRSSRGRRGGHYFLSRLREPSRFRLHQSEKKLLEEISISVAAKKLKTVRAFGRQRERLSRLDEELRLRI
jgi:hypothetical protein